MSKWDKPQETTQLDVVFGGKMEKLLPAMRDIPDEFGRWNNPWVRCAGTWFAAGLKDLKIFPKAGIDGAEALGHVKAIMVSFEPKHEHKEAGCAYLLSLWFDRIQWDGGVAPENGAVTAEKTSVEAKTKESQDTSTEAK